MRFRPLFSVRTLAIVVTLVCAYFAAWEVTKRWGIRDPLEPESLAEIDGQLTRVVYIHDEGESSPMPLVIYRHQFNGSQLYYLWLFGPKFKLPFESTLE